MLQISSAKTRTNVTMRTISMWSKCYLSRTKWSWFLYLYPRIFLEIRMKVAARSVLSIPTVLRIKAVFEINALTYALVSAV